MLESAQLRKPGPSSSGRTAPSRRRCAEVRSAAADAPCSRRGRARQRAGDSTGPRRRRRCPRSSAAACLDDVPLDDLVPFIDWTFFFAAWQVKGRFPAVLDHPSTARRPANSTMTARRCWTDRDGPARRRAASTASGPPPATATTSWCSPTRRRHGRARALPHAAPAGADRGRQAEPQSSPTSSRPRRLRASPTTSARSRSRRASARTTS